MRGSVFNRVLGVVVPFAAAIMALAIAAALIAAAGASPVEAYLALIKGSVGSVDALATTLVRATPLILAGLGVAVAFRAKIWNIGAEGQLYIGALFATVVAINFDGLPVFIHLPLSIAAGFVGGALWAAIAGYLRARKGTNEIVTTLMLNYIALYLVNWMVAPNKGPIAEANLGFNASYAVAKSSELPVLLSGTSLHAGILVAIAAAVILHLVVWYTPFGFRLRMLGENVFTTRYAGVSVARQIMIVMLVSGGLAGLAGASEILGLKLRLYESFSPGYGYTAIAIALLGRCEPLGVVFAALFFAALSAGANLMQQTVDIPVSLAQILQSLTVLFALAGMGLTVILRRYLERTGKKQPLTLSEKAVDGNE